MFYNTLCYPRLANVKSIDAYLSSGSGRNSIKRLHEATEYLNDLIHRYSGYLSEHEQCQARTLIWGSMADTELITTAFRVFLCNTYNVWDSASIARYEKLLAEVRTNNPEWLDDVERAHLEKIKRVKIGK